MPPRTPDVPAFDDVPNRPESLDPTSRLAALRESVGNDPRAIADRAINAIRSNPNMSTADAVALLRQTADVLGRFSDTAPRGTARQFAALRAEGDVLDNLNPRLALRANRMALSGSPVTVPVRTRGYVGSPELLARELAGRTMATFQGMSNAELTDLHEQMMALNRMCGTNWRPVRLRGNIDENGDNVHDCIWVDDPRQQGAYLIVPDMMTNEFLARDAEFSARGFRIREHSTWLNAQGEEVHWVLWEQVPRQSPAAFMTGGIGMLPPPLIRAARVFPGAGPVPPPGVGFGRPTIGPGPIVPGRGPIGPGPVRFAGGPVPPTGGPVRFPPGFRG